MSPIKTASNCIAFILLFSFLFDFHAVKAQITWEPIRDVTSPSIAHNWPRISLNGSGEPVVIWGNLERVMFSKWEGTKFSQAIAVNPPRVTIAEAGWMGPEFCTYGDTIYVVYKETPENLEGKYVWCVSSFDGGDTWNTPVKVDQLGVDRARFPVVTTDKDGHPVVGFMRSDERFHDTRWVVARSNDHGLSFTLDTLASGWSGQRSEACDCCPGSMDSDGDRIALFYRDNLFDLRECWAGLSVDGGESFTKGVNVDETGWMINSCPSSAIDGVIIGDSLYSAFMSGSSGSARVYFSRSSVSQDGKSVQPMISPSPGLRSQNYPRMDHYKNAVGAAWIQYSGDRSLIPIKFSPDIQNAPLTLDTVALGNAENLDIAISEDRIFVIWKDPGARAIRYRVGRYQQVNPIVTHLEIKNIHVSPNPSKYHWTVSGTYNKGTLEARVYNSSGVSVFNTLIRDPSNIELEIQNQHLPPGNYFLNLTSNNHSLTIPLIKL